MSLEGTPDFCLAPKSSRPHPIMSIGVITYGTVEIRVVNNPWWRVMEAKNASVSDRLVLPESMCILDHSVP